jgi:hypothetical protein
MALLRQAGRARQRHGGIASVHMSEIADNDDVHTSLINLST